VGLSERTVLGSFALLLIYLWSIELVVSGFVGNFSIIVASLLKTT